MCLICLFYLAGNQRTSAEIDPNREKKNEAMRSVFYNPDVKIMTMKKDSPMPTRRPPSQPIPALTQQAVESTSSKHFSSPTPSEISVDTHMTR